MIQTNHAKHMDIQAKTRNFPHHRGNSGRSNHNNTQTKIDKIKKHKKLQRNNPTIRSKKGET